MPDSTSTCAGTARLFRWAVGLEWFTVAWNVIEAGVAIWAGSMAGSTAPIGFGGDSFIEVISAVAVLWRLLRAGPAASEAEHTAAGSRALYLVAITLFLLAAYVAIECTISLLNHQTADASTADLILAVASLVVMPMLAYAKRRIGKQLESAVGAIAMLPVIVWHGWETLEEAQER